MSNYRGSLCPDKAKIGDTWRIIYEDPPTRYAQPRNVIISSIHYSPEFGLYSLSWIEWDSFTNSAGYFLEGMSGYVNKCMEFVSRPGVIMLDVSNKQEPKQYSRFNYIDED